MNVENVYHEALVHPAMFAHPGPKRVAILGGGEGATAREVLKHKTIEGVTMIELDPKMIEVAREYLAPMCNCSDLIGRAECCFDDELLTVHNAEGNSWFMERYGPDSTNEKFDVVIIDALDPEDDQHLSEMLYNDKVFIDALINSLSPDGVMVVQIGTTATIDDVRPDMGIYRIREMYFNHLEAHPDVEALMVYEEPNCGFLEPHAFLVVCKSVECRSRWYARSDQIDYEIYDRIVRTHSGNRGLTYFDGTTQRSYQWPKKGWETVYCRREPMPFECQYRSLSMDADILNFSIDDEENSAFRVEVSKDESGKIQGTRVFARTDIKKGSFIMPNHVASSLQVTTRNLDGLRNNVEIGGGRVALIEDLLDFFGKFIHESVAVEGSEHNFVEIGGSCLIRRTNTTAEANIGRWMPPHPSGKRPKFSPVYERNRVSFDVFIVATRDIRAGEELLIPSDLWQ
jgi:predicted O-methyltransferase YrrM